MATHSSKKVSEQRGQRQTEGRVAEVSRRTDNFGAYSDVLGLQRDIGNRAVGELIQGKLTVSNPGDRYEQEADQVAEHVMRMPASSTIARSVGLNYTTVPHIQRACTKCDEENEKKVHRKELSGPTPDVAPAVTSSIHSLRNRGGQPLPESVRAFFEPRFGFDFSQVRIHNNTQATETVQSVNARAFTLGRDVVFGAGQYAPGTPVGQRLLAHELTHVVQQTGGSSTNPIHQPGNEGAPSTLNSSHVSTVAASGGPQATIQRKDVDAGIGGLIGNSWLRLPTIAKAQLIDVAIKETLEYIREDKFPGQEILGGIWIFVKEGLIGFLEQLKTTKENVKILVLDKIATIISGKDQAFTWAFLTGLLKGFFIDGALGIFIAIWDLVKGLGQLWDFLKAIGDQVGGFPDEMLQLLVRSRNVGKELAETFGPAIDELKRMVTSPEQAGAFKAVIVEKGKAYAKEGGAKIAEKLMNFFSDPNASAEIGEVTGSLLGMALWEVVFAAVTAGGGVAVTAIKEGAASLGKLFAKIVEGVLKIVEEIRLLFGKIVNWVKEAITFVKGKLSEVGGKFGKLLEDVMEFFGNLLKSCHESKISCKWPKHHPWPQYLGGLRDQTLKKIPRKLHERFHSLLDKWMGGKYARAKGAESFKGMSRSKIIKDLREFYKTADNGAFAKYLPDFEDAVKETLKGVE